MNCYIKINSRNKAKQDIDQLMAGMGYRNIAVSGVGGKKVETFLRKVFTLAASLFRLHKGDVLLMQYPYKKFYALQCRLAHLKGAKVITLIHDLGTFRRRKLTAEQEMRRLSHTDYIIAHNDRMKQWLVEHGRSAATIGTLGIFDYLSDEAIKGVRSEELGVRSEELGVRSEELGVRSEELGVKISNLKFQISNIIYAGRLGERKNAFLYQASDEIEGCVMDLYGSGNLDYSRFGKNIHHHGRIDSDKFISMDKDGWGLVWDGDSCNGCGGIWGEYLKINNPHKCSFYLRAGLPVIVWSQSAMADFVLTNKVGIAVERLSDIPEAIQGVGEQELSQIKDNVASMQQRLNEGYYFKRSMAEALGQSVIKNKG